MVGYILSKKEKIGNGNPLLFRIFIYKTKYENATQF